MRLLDDAIERSKRAYVSPASIALVYIGLGDFERAMDWLELGYKERDHSLVTIKADPAYDPLRRHPRFVSLLGRMKFD
jgi:adenylate cyclase